MTLAHPKPVKREKPKRKRISRQTPVKKRSSKRPSVEKADQEWAAKVKSRAGGKCEFQNCPMPATDAHHVYGKKAFPRLRYDLDNGVALCRIDHQNWHAYPVLFREWFGVTYPDGLRRLKAKAVRENRLSQ